MLDPAITLLAPVIVTDKSLGGDTRPHHVPHRSSPATGLEAYSCNVHSSVSLLGSTAAALQSPQRFTPSSLTKNLASPGLSTVSPRSVLNTSASIDRKSTRLNSSHLGISYAVFCLKKTTMTNNA